MIQRVLWTMAVAAALGASSSAVTQQPAAPDTMTPIEGLALVKQLNTIMGRLYVRSNAQMDLKDVVEDDTFTRAQGFELLNDQQGLYKRYRVTITHVTGDKESYQLSLVPASGCGPSWFSNETNLIFTGTCVQ